MRLTLQTDYALRVLVRLALIPGQTVTIERVASEYRISKNHLMKVALQLNRLGYIEAVRGRSGGLRLVRPASSIFVGDVVVAMEPDMAIVECFQQDRPACQIGPACRLKGILHGATAAFIAHLNRFTLHDLVERREVLEGLLA